MMGGDKRVGCSCARTAFADFSLVKDYPFPSKSEFSKLKEGCSNFWKDEGYAYAIVRGSNSYEMAVLGDTDLQMDVSHTMLLSPAFSKCSAVALILC